MTSASGSGAAPDVRHEILFDAQRAYFAWWCRCGLQFQTAREAESHAATEAGRQAARESLAEVSAPAAPEAPKPDDARIYPCAICGVMRSKNEGGTVFTVCDECWDAKHGKPSAPDVAAPLSEDGQRTYREICLLLEKGMTEKNEHAANAYVYRLDALLRSVLVERERYKTENDEWRKAARDTEAAARRFAENLDRKGATP